MKDGASVTTLSTKEFAQLLQACNLTVRAEANSAKNCPAQPRNSALVLRPPASWSRTKSFGPTLKWHHTNFDPDKSRKKKASRPEVQAQKLPTIPPKRITEYKPAAPPESKQARHTQPRPAPLSDPKPTPPSSSARPGLGDTRTLAQQALPLPLAWRDLAERDIAVAETIKETVKSNNVYPRHDAFLGFPDDGDCDVVLSDLRDPVTSQSEASDATQVSSADSVFALGDVETLAGCQELVCPEIPLPCCAPSPDADVADVVISDMERSGANARLDRCEDRKGENDFQFLLFAVRSGPFGTSGIDVPESRGSVSFNGYG